MRFLFNFGECMYLVSFWGYKKYTLLEIKARFQEHIKGAFRGFTAGASGERPHGGQGASGLCVWRKEDVKV